MTLTEGYEASMSMLRDEEMIMASDTRSSRAAAPSREAIQNWLQLYIAESIQVEVEEVDITLPFSYYGLDSVAALGFAGELEIWLGRELPQTLTWDYPNIELLSAFLARA